MTTDASAILPMTPLRAAVYAALSSVIFGCMFLPIGEVAIAVPLAAVPLIWIVRRTPGAGTARTLVTDAIEAAKTAHAACAADSAIMQD